MQINIHYHTFLFNFCIVERNPEGIKLRDFNKSITVILISEEDKIKSLQKDTLQKNLISFARFMRILHNFISLRI